MSYAKAADLLRVAEMAMSRYGGIALSDVTAEFGCDHRTAQRMMRSFETVFPQVEIREDEDRRRRWHMPRHDPRWLQAQGVRDGELAALDMAIRRAERDAAPDEAQRLQVLRDRLLAAMPSSLARRTEADAEALLEAQGFASRPGPRVRPDLRMLGALTEALRAPFTVTLTYVGADGSPSERLLEPYGLLLGTRRYLVARPVGGTAACGASGSTASAMPRSPAEALPAIPISTSGRFRRRPSAPFIPMPNTGRCNGASRRPSRWSPDSSCSTQTR